ncbi:MAG: hypothetical protein ACRCTQ_01305 [Brevinemataceae bacterium]
MNEQKLQIIYQAEQKAKEILCSVEENVQTIIKNANEEAVSIMEKAKSTARDSREQIVAEFREEGQKESQKILSNLDKDLTVLDREAEKHKARVTVFLIEQMKVRYGNS